MSKVVALIDADTLKYMSSAVIEHYDKETETLTIDPVHFAYHTIALKIQKILERCKTKNIECFLTKIGDKTNFRFELYDLYKKNRESYRKPFHLNDVHQYIKIKYNCSEAIGEEADDTITIRHYELNQLGFDKKYVNSVICSIDKDFNNVPGWHYHYQKDVFYFIDELQAKKNFYMQIMTGDVADNVPRVKKRWLKSKTEEKIKLAQTEEEIARIVLDEVIRVQEVSEVDARQYIEKIGQLVWLRTKPDEMWRFKL